MSYLKLPKTVMDHAVGFQSVNQAIDNNDALLTAFDAKHSIGVGGNSPYGEPLRALGRHDDVLIARTVADFDVDTTLPTPALRPLVSGPALGFNSVRLGTGIWKIYVVTTQSFGAVALMRSTGSVDRKATCYRSYDPAVGYFVIVSTWELSAGTWAPADLAFSLQVWTPA